MNASSQTVYPTRTVRGACPHDCPDSCGWIVTVEERPTGAVPVKLRGNPDHPFSKGELCPKVNRFVERAMSPDRVLTPLRRVGPKGSGSFQSVSWDDALAEIASRWSEIVRVHGGESIVPFFSAGNQSTLSMEFPSRFLAALGASRPVGSVCGQVSSAGTALTYGTSHSLDPTLHRHAKLILLWGTNTKLANRHLWPYVEEARANGATIVVIDPIRTMTAEDADVFVQPLPGTDVALMLAVAHVLIRDDLIDQDYISRYASGFDEFAAHVASWTPERAAGVCGLDVATIESLATLYGSRRPAAIRTLIGAEHAEHGATFFRTLAMLPVLVGAWRDLGGGYSRSTGVWSSGAMASLERPHLASGRAVRSVQVNHISRWIHDETVRSMLIWAVNPLVTFPNADEIRRGLERDDLFTVVHDQFLTDTAKYADIVLPATTQIEQLDVVPSWGSPHINWNEPAIAPRGESVSNTELFRRLAASMRDASAAGFDDACLYDSDEQLVAQLFDGNELLGGATMETLRQRGTIPVQVPERLYAHGGFRTSDGKAHLASEELARRGLGLVPDWRPAEEGVGASAEVRDAYPFILLTPKSHTRFLNSSYSALAGHGDREGAPFVELHADDAAALGLTDGDLAEVGNARGVLRLTVRTSTRARVGVAIVPFGWSRGQHGDGGTANSLTNDTLANWGGGVAYNDTRVYVKSPSTSGW